MLKKKNDLIPPRGLLALIYAEERKLTHGYWEI